MNHLIGHPAIGVGKITGNSNYAWGIGIINADGDISGFSVVVNGVRSDTILWVETAQETYGWDVYAIVF